MNKSKISSNGRIPGMGPFPRFNSEKSMESPSRLNRIKITRDELVEDLKHVGEGWDDGIVDLLEIPETLTKLKTASGTYYCDSDDFSSIFLILSSFISGEEINDLPDFGLALFSTGGGVFMLFVDGERNVIFRERIFCIHDDPPAKKWGSIRDSLGSLLESSNEDSVMVYDLGFIRSV